MATYYTLLTKIGQARIANAVALNQKVNLTYMAVGDGNGNPTTPNENQTALVREKYRATINQLTVDTDNPNYLVAEMIVPTNVGGWSIYEVGVFDDQNQLIAVANFPATYKPELVEGSGRDLIVRIIIQVSNTSVVTLKIDPAITLASQAWVAANYVKKITVAGGTTGQILAKKSNANEDFQWVDPTAAVDVNVFSREETQTVASGQTIVNLAQLTTDGAAIYIEGIRLRDDQFTVNSATRLTLATSYPAGTKVTIVQNEETSRNAFTLKANNLSDLADKPTALANLDGQKKNVNLTALSGLNGIPDGLAFFTGPGAMDMTALTRNGRELLSKQSVLETLQYLTLGDGTGRFLGVQVFGTSGTYTKSPGVKKIIIEAVGGGGASGNLSATADGNCGVSAAGSPGAYGKAIYYQDIPETVPVTIGSGGVAGTGPGGSGGDGGQTSFGSLIVCPGGRGSTQVQQVPPFSGGSATEASQPTGSGLIFHSVSRSPSCGALGLGDDQAIGLESTITTILGIYGKGGTGKYNKANSPSATGNNGHQGYILVWEYQ